MDEAPTLLARLSRSEIWARLPRAAFHEIVGVAAQAVNVARVGVWLYDADSRVSMRCVALQSGANTTEGGAVLRSEDYPLYFGALDMERIIAADDAMNDPRTQELRDTYLHKLGIGAMLDAPIVVRGRSVGVVCHEHVGPPRTWTESEKLTAANIADFVAMVIVSDEERKAREQLVLTRAASHVATWTWDISENRWHWSPELGPILGLPWNHQPASAEDYLERVHPDDRDSITHPQASRVPSQGYLFRNAHRIVRPSGECRWVETRAELQRGTDGQPVRMIGTVADVTERKLLREQGGRRTRIEDLGHVAAGVAHDFNNLLTVILMGVELAESAVKEDADLGIEFVREAADSAKALTSRILAFARTRPSQAAFVQPAGVLTSLKPMLSKLCPPGVRLSCSSGDGLPEVRVDPVELEQVVMNLVVNARDAVGQEGTVSLLMDQLALTEGHSGESGALLPGDYVRIRVADSGEGIRGEDIGRIFEPLFTTKPVGDGTGIGLATCRRIVEGAGGTISVVSTLGVGSEFTVLLPAARRQAPAVEEGPEEPLEGGKRVLVVGGTPSVRELAVRTLQSAGHAVFVARDEQDAAQRLAEVGEVDLIFADTATPPGTGSVYRQRGGRPVCLICNHCDAEDYAHILRKPFTGTDLLRVVDQLTGSPHG